VTTFSEVFNLSSPDSQSILVTFGNTSKGDVLIYKEKQNPENSFKIKIKSSKILLDNLKEGTFYVIRIYDSSSTKNFTEKVQSTC